MRRKLRKRKGKSVRTVTFKKFTHLIEGVHNGFTFSLLDDSDTTMHTEAQCKDYFQDLWWAENTGKPADVWGFKWKPGTIELDVPTYRFALKDKNGEYVMKDEAPKIVAFLNKFEKALEYSPLSTYEETTDPSVVILTFPAGWTKYNPMVSALTTIIRLGLKYDGSDLADYLAMLGKTFTMKDYSYGGKAPKGFYNAMVADMGRFTTIHPRLRALAKGKEANPKWSTFPSGHSAHEGGIVGYKSFPAA